MTTSTPSTFELTSRTVHRLVEGDSLKETLVGLLGELPRLEAHATGRVDSVRLVGESARPGEHLVVTLSCAVTKEGVTMALVARGPDRQVVAGLLDDARAVDLELSVDRLDRARATMVPQTKPQARIKSAESKVTSWAAVAAASAKAQAEADAAEAAEEESGVPTVGDRIDHATFGRCVVEKIDDDEEYIMVRTSAKRLLRLSLDVLRLELVGDDADGRLFRARGKRT